MSEKVYIDKNEKETYFCSGLTEQETVMIIKNRLMLLDHCGESKKSNYHQSALNAITFYVAEFKLEHLIEALAIATEIVESSDPLEEFAKIYLKD